MAKPSTVDIAPGDAGYTMTIEVHRVVPEQIVYSNEFDKTGTKVGRRVIEQGRLVIRDSDPERLKNRAAQAMSVILASEAVD